MSTGRRRRQKDEYRKDKNHEFRTEKPKPCVHDGENKNMST